MKKRSLFIVSVLLVLSACSGFLANKDIGSPSGGKKLELVGGGYLSSPDYNDISPFLYRNTNTGDAWLFFSSDRGGGNYQIYYSKMASDGRFYPPVKMDFNINDSAGDQFSPQVFQEYSDPAAIYLTFLRTNAASNCMVTVGLSNDFSFITNLQTLQIYEYSATGLGYAMNGYTPYIYLFTGGTDYFVYSFYSAEPYGYWNDGSYQSPAVMSFSQPVSSGAVYSDWDHHYLLLSDGTAISNASYIYNYYNYYFSSMNNYGIPLRKKSRAFLNEVMSTNATNGYLPVSVYGGIGKDKDPFVDIYGSYQVYFASTRTGNGNFDLYRYNQQTFDKYAPLLPPLNWYSLNDYTNIDVISITTDVEQVITTNTNPYYLYLDTIIDWDENIGAEGYRIYYATNAGEPKDYQLLTNVYGSEYILQTNIEDLFTAGWSIMIKSYNSRGESVFGSRITPQLY